MIRAFEPSDLDDLLELFAASVYALAGEYTPEQRAAWAPPDPDRAAWRERLSSGHVRVAQRHGRIAGFARTTDDGCIDLLYVHPDCVRRGVGGELLRDAVAWLGTCRVSPAWAHVSHTAKPVFERAGFRAVERRTVDRGGVTMDNWLMVRADNATAEH